MNSPNWKQMLVAALVPASSELVWVLYNTYVPLYLQAGNPTFSGNAALKGFGLTAALTGLVLTSGNLIGLVVNPVVGVLSDSTHSRFGRRKPWYVIPAPFILVALCLVPFLAQNASLQVFLLDLGMFLLALAVMRGPATVLLYDITPSKFRSMAAALSSIAGGTAGILGALLAAALFGINPSLPFYVVSGLTGAAITLAAVTVREPPFSSTQEPGTRLSPGGTISLLTSQPREALLNTLLLLCNTFFTYIAFGQMQTFTSSYSITVLGLSMGSAPLVYATGGAAFILFSFPASAIATKWLKRKFTQMLGICLFVPIAMLVYYFSTPLVIWPLMALLGASWALVMVAQEPMVLDSAPSDALLGTYSAILQVARTLGFVVSPLLGGWIIQLMGNDYNAIWLVMAGAQMMALVALLPVTRGEAR